LNVQPLEIPDVVELRPTVFSDDRGFFFEAWNQRLFDEAIGVTRFVQDNHSRSGLGVLRGLHYQIGQPQGKLVRVTRGAVYDVAVDIRRGSAHFGHWVGAELSGDNKLQLWIPAGFAHGFLTLTDDTEVMYKTTEFYNPALDRSIVWNDPEISIAWPDTGREPTVSAKDAAAPFLKDAEVFE
jgi:dTDP-4-dehydrorhamnose 3,5-epimerase